MFERRRSRRIYVGRVPVGGGAPISIQSMTVTKTDDVQATLIQVHELATQGADIVRVAVPHLAVDHGLRQREEVVDDAVVTRDQLGQIP